MYVLIHYTVLNKHKSKNSKDNKVYEYVKIENQIKTRRNPKNQVILVTRL